MKTLYKYLYFIYLTCFVSVLSWAQPANDLCANATPLTVDAACTNGTNVAATISAGENTAPTNMGCWLSAISNTVWYTFTTGAAGNYTVTTDNGGTTDTQIKVLSGTCGAFTLVAGGCNEDGGANNTLAGQVSVALAASTTYFIQVDVFGATTGTFCISVSFPVPPVNDLCSNATVLTVDAACTNGTNALSTISAGENVAPTNAGCWGSAISHTVWYTFTTAAAGNYVISTDNGGTTDTQIKVFSGTCGAFTLVTGGCNEDGGAVNTLASQVGVTLAASTTYFVQVDVFGATTGSFCINVTFPVPPINDCVLNATNITAQINGLSPTNLFDCTPQTYNAAGPGGDPTRDNLAGDPNGCNGNDILGASIPDHRDIWYTFTITAGVTPPAWLSVYHQTGTVPTYITALYSGTPTGTCGAAGSISGLTQIDCSSGDLIGVPPGNTTGGTRDAGKCTTPLNPRIKLNGLAPGTYYFRIFEFAGGAPPNGTFNLCAEYGIPSAPATDGCPTMNTVGCNDVEANRDVLITYFNTGNNASTGNACNTAPNEPQLAAGAAGQIRDNCAGGFVTQVGYANNVINNTAIYQFTVNALPPCVANVLITFNNLQYGGTNGNIAQMQVMNGTCANGTSAVMTGTTAAGCLQMRPVGGTLPNGTYYIVVDGQDGQLLQYDLTLSITYTGSGCTALPCGTVLSVDLTMFTAESGGEESNRLRWTTESETNNDYFTIEKSTDGANFLEIGKLDGAGSVNETTEYAFTDTKGSDPLAYYRLKQTDFDGKYSYSSIVLVAKDADESGIVKLDTKAETNSLNVTYLASKEGPVSVQIYDLMGSLLYSGTHSSSKGLNEFPIEISSYKNGAYIVRANDSLKENSQKFFKNW